jgi:hypothetical protein
MVRFYFNGVATHAIDDDSFAELFFNIWLNEHTRDALLRRQLLNIKH